MTLDENRLLVRADELTSRARDAGVIDVDQEMALLPEGDVVARIAYLANALGIDPSRALDVDTSIEEGD